MVPTPTPSRITVLTYNTHLFKGFAETLLIDLGQLVTGQVILHDDDARQKEIKQRIRTSGADIVLLQEVWAVSWQDNIIAELRDVYPYGWHAPHDDLRMESLVVSGGNWKLSAGVLMLSKYPLKAQTYRGFSDLPDGMDARSTKGVISATVVLPSGHEFQISTSHAGTDMGGEQQPNIRQIAESTLMPCDGPAIMAGDFNVHASKRAVMTGIFTRVAGARDAWNDLHRTDGAYADTINLRENRLAQIFTPGTNPNTPGDNVDRIDYMFVRNGGSYAFQAVSAEVLRDWKYPPDRPTMDLSDHYPLRMTFEIKPRPELPQIAPWQIKTGYAGFNSSSRASLVLFRGGYHAFVRDSGSPGDGLMHYVSTDGAKWEQAKEVHPDYTTSAGPTAIVLADQLHVFIRSGNSRDVLELVSADGVTFSRATVFDTGLDCSNEVSAARLGTTLCLVFLNGGSNNLECATRAVGSSQWNTRSITVPDNAQDPRSPAVPVFSSAPPCLIAHNGLFHVFYRDASTAVSSSDENDGLMHICSRDGWNWYKATPHHPDFRTSAGPAAVELDGALHLFFRDGDGNGILQIASFDGGSSFMPIGYVQRRDWYTGVTCAAEPAVISFNRQISLLALHAENAQMHATTITAPR